MGIMGGMGGVGTALMNIAQQNQKAWQEQDLRRMMQEGEEQKELRLLDARTQAGIMSHRANTQATADIAETAAQRNRDRVAGYGGDVDAAAEAGDLQSAEGLKKLGDTSLEEYHKAAAGDIAKRGDYYSAMADSIREGRGRNGTGKDGLGQAKFDEQMVSNHVKENAAFYTFTNDMDPTGKPQENLVAKQTYVGLVRKRGPEVADEVMELIMDKAQQMATDPKTGNIDQTKANAAYLAGVSALRAQMTAGSRSSVEPGKPMASPGQPALKGAPQVMAEDLGYSPENDTQFEYVMNNLSSPSMRRQAMAWLEGGMLSLGKRQQVERALR